MFKTLIQLAAICGTISAVPIIKRQMGQAEDTLLQAWNQANAHEDVSATEY